MNDGIRRGNLLRDLIYAHYERQNEPRRANRVRPSGLGNPCERALWLNYRWCDSFEEPDGRVLRLFSTGHREEARVISELRNVGAIVHDVNPDNPKEQISINMHEGHVKGFLDGICDQVPHAHEETVVLEIKTHSLKSFTDLVKKGVQASKPQHYAQMQLYMSEHNISEGLYYAVNKNTDDLHLEFIDIDEDFCKRLNYKIDRIIGQEEPPQRINENPTFFGCRFCPAYDVCHGEEKPPETCRSCVHGSPAIGGDWHCGLHDTALDLKAQKKGCDSYKVIDYKK